MRITGVVWGSRRRMLCLALKRPLPWPVEKGASLLIASRASWTAAASPLVAALVSCANPPGAGQGETPGAQKPAVEVEARSTQRAAQAARLCSAPRYPAEALRADAAGTTRLRMEVSEEGRVMRSTVERSAGPTDPHKLLDQAAIDSFKDCPFRPATDSQGKPVRGFATVEFHWRIENAKR